MTDTAAVQSDGLIISPDFFQQYDKPLIRDRIRREREKRSAERNLVDFIKLFWDIIEPGREFVGNWHIDLIAEHLQAVADGEIRDLLVNIPPGCAKSLIISVFFPAWLWTRDPAARFLGASYGEELAVRDSTKCRDIITSEKYQEYWPHIRPKSGQDQKLKYTLETGGWRMATSVGGRATGEHPTYKIVDDPHSALQAASDAERDRANRWFTETLSTRGAALNASTIVVMQRLHQLDTAGVILEQLGGYEHLCLPMRYDPGHPYRSAKDPRKKPGELLWPEMFDDVKTTMLERRLGEYGTSGQLQQLPSPPGGGILKVEGMKIWPNAREFPQFQYIVQSYDTAFTEKTSGDPTACTVWGVFEHENSQQVMLLDCWTEHLSYPNLRKRVLADWEATYGAPNKQKDAWKARARRADLILVEQKGSGQSILQDLQAANINCRGYNPGKADKISRAHQIAPILDLGILWVPESQRTEGEYVSWSRPLLLQMEKFPNAEHDDLVDTLTQAMIFLRDMNMFDLPYAEDIYEEEEVDYRRKMRQNPYAL